jgi:hypothetical protein
VRRSYRENGPSCRREYGAVAQYAASGGKRDFVSAPSIQADRYDVQVDEEAADQAMRVLGGMTEAR